MKNMQVLIDTNVIVDVLSNRTGLVEYSSKVLKYCEVGLIDAHISALSIPNIIYICRKNICNNQIEELVDILNNMFKIESLDKNDILKARNYNMADFDDSLQVSCAEKINADYIVTNNEKDFSNSPIRAISPKELIKKMTF